MKFFRRKRSRLECENEMLRYQLKALQKAMGDRKIADSVKPCYSGSCSHCRFSLSVDGFLIGCVRDSVCACFDSSDNARGYSVVSDFLPDNKSSESNHEGEGGETERND
jgi:hypothetical protein|nr:MAG TPA: hypothetical protein [Caudoviricetes sp.]